LRGRPLVEHAIGAMCEVDELARIVVVLGARADELLGTVDFGRAEPVSCSEWSEGMSASLRAGIEALGGASERVIVTLGDAPTVSAMIIRRLLAAEPGARAAYGGRPGHPVSLGPEQLRQLDGVGGDVGAREILAGSPLIECGDLASGLDVDTVADLERLRLDPG